MATAATPAPTPPARAPEKKVAPPVKKGPLYERLGGEPAVTAAVDGFLKRVAADKRVNGRFINVDLGRLRTLMIQFMSNATGGQVAYAGRDMQDTHAGLQIVEEEFNAIVEDLVGSLDELKVPAAEKNELLGALGPLKGKIVSPPPEAASKHDPALAQKAHEAAQELQAGEAKQAGDWLEGAITARERGQRNYADQLFSAAERLAPAGKLAPLVPLFREGAPERITTELKQLPKDTPAQPKGAVGSSDDETKDTKSSRASLTGKLTFEGGGDLLGVVTLEKVNGKPAKRTPKQRTVEQRERQFAPRLLAVPVGSTVSFPNFDPIFHNVFSLSPARAFDLGIYKNGETRDVTFKKEGLVRLGCNLHANMSAHVVVVSASHYVVTAPDGQFAFHKLTPGKYQLRAWGEDSSEAVEKTIQIKAGENSLDLAIARGKSEGLGTDKFGVPRASEP